MDCCEEKIEFIERKIFKVSEITCLIKDLLEENFPSLWIEGEIANLRSPNSGHLYFTLRDEKASLRAVLFKSHKSFLNFSLENGLSVLCWGRLGVYEPRGEYQLIVQWVEPKGWGALQLAFEQLKKKLAQKGFFDEARKRSLPLLPKKVGIVTSLSGAALRDFLKVSLARYPHAHIVICPVKVQGEGSAQEIAEAINFLSKYPDIDLIVVTRGGGSLEDLWSFNEEIVAQAIYESSVPVVSAIGHEIDYTICDFVADKRAPTPTAAAQLVFPSKEELLLHLGRLQEKLFTSLKSTIASKRQSLLQISKRLKDPLQNLEEGKMRLNFLKDKLFKAIFHFYQEKATSLNSLEKQLEALSPFSVLNRGYSLVRKFPEGKIIKSIQDVSLGEQVEIVLAEGKLLAKIEKFL